MDRERSLDILCQKNVPVNKTCLVEEVTFVRGIISEPGVIVHSPETTWSGEVETEIRQPGIKAFEILPIRTRLE